jgi:ribosomal-protein-alanine N-acetyltransferase
MEAVKIRPARRSDAADLIQANLESREYHAPWVHPFLDQAGFESWFGQLASGPNIGLVARETGSDAIIGVFNISQIFFGGFGNAYLGFYGAAALARRGFMTQALGKTVEYAFEEIGLHRLEANIQPENSASIALVRRVGFQKEGFSPRYLKIGGIWRDHERWALVGRDF